jgi:Predicted esterase of the alpha/beta hydrolase fold
LVAPANPARFGEAGFARHSLTDYKDYFHQLKINVPTTLLISENDPWLDFFDALQLAKAWQLNPINLGEVGHINVASGFGPFPDLLNYLLPEDSMCSHSSIDPVKTHFSLKFA